MTQELWTHERLRPKVWKGEAVQYKQHKLNGHRFTVYKQSDNTLVGFERIISLEREITVRHPEFIHYEWWQALKQLPPMSSVDGELYVQNGNAGDAAHAIAGCLPSLDFRPFAVSYWENRNIPHFNLTVINDVLKATTGLSLIPFFFMRDSDTEEQLLADAHDLCIEGWVLKQSNYSGWWKCKPTKTVDCVVTGFKDGNGKYLGLVGALKVSTPIIREDGLGVSLLEVASVSGMDDETRVNIDEKKDLGRVCEVEYQELGNGNRLVHPRFIRWRDDKPANECIYDIEEL